MATTTASSIQQTSLTTTASNLQTSASVDKTGAVALANGAASSVKHSKYKAFVELKEREEFLHKLKEFHKAKGTPINNYPTLNGKLIDLHSLYQKVVSQGGWEKVCEKEKWDEVAVEFNIPTNCSNGSHALKMIYLRYLSLYEKIIFFGEDALVKDDEEEDSRRKFNHILKSVPMTYNNHQHLSSISNGSSSLLLNGIMMNGGGGSSSSMCMSPAANSNYVNNNDASQRNSSVSNFDKLENSLTSGLPNEVDFVFNTILILSNDDSFSFRMNGTNTRLVDLMLAHVGFFGEDSYNYRLLYDKWRKHNNRNFVKFWHDSVKTNNKEILKLLPVIYNKFLIGLPSQELLNLRQENGMSNVEAQRIEQALVILNNLSFDENNVDFLSKSNTLFQYLLLSSHCTYSDIRKLSLDVLANICHKISLSNLTSIDIDRLFYTIKQLLLSSDRYEIIRGFEIITKLCLINDNEELITVNLDNDVYEIISELLTVQDFLLLTYALECLYQLSQFSETVCNQLTSSSKSIISLLISYLTVDSTYFQSLKMLDIKPPKATPVQMMTAPQVVSMQNRVQMNNNSHAAAQVISYPIIQQQINSQEQQAKLSLCNWFKNCFIFNSTYQISKTELYCYYKHIAKINNWVTFPIPTFFELLQQTFPLLKTDDNANTITGLKLVVNNINQNVNNQPSPVVQISSPKPQQPQVISVNNVAIQQHQIQIIQRQTAPTQQLQPQPVVVATTAPAPPSLSTNDSLVKTLQLNINESSSSSTVSTFSTSSSTSSTTNGPSVTQANKEIHMSCDDDLNNIKENINFTKLNENLKISEDSQDKKSSSSSSYLDKLEKVGEAEPALNILCNNKDIKLSKIERLVNEVTVVKNGFTNNNKINGELPSEDDSSSSGEEELNRHAKLPNGLKNGESSSHLTNGHHHHHHQPNDESDGIIESAKFSVKAEEEVKTTTIKINGNGGIEATSASVTTTVKTNGVEQISVTTKTEEATTYVNGYSKIKLNGENSNSSCSSSSTDLKIDHESKKRKKSTDSMTKGIEENLGKKRQKKINEIDTESTKPDGSSSINKILVNNSSTATELPTQPSTTVQPPSTNNTPAINPNANNQTIYVQQQSQIVNNNSNYEYLCEWNNCKMAFPNSKSVYNHVFKNHLLHLIHTDNRTATVDSGINCLWTGCDHVKRQKWALISHLQERHCTEQALRNAILCRQKNMILQTNTPAINPQLAYSKDAAFYAIYRAQRPVGEDFSRMEDQSIAKSIRLLAALCLRNLSINSPLAKRALKQYESYLTNIAFDLVESSNAISSCLWQLTH